MNTQQLVTRLNSSLNEKDVENIWRELILSFFSGAQITSPFNTDGYLETLDQKISILLEFKFKENLKSKLSQVSILSQTLYYLKKFEVTGKKLPKIVFIADKNECFAIHTNSLIKYLSYDLNWGAAASTAFRTNPELIQEMLGDSDINPFVFDIVPGFVLKAIENKFLDLSENVRRVNKVTEKNITGIFEYFCDNVLGKNNLTVNETANLFINLIISPDDHYIKPKRKNILVTKSFGDIHVNERNYMMFDDHFNGEKYSIREKEALTAIVDRIVEDETRRRKGEFFTPTIWVDEAHKMISETFGENWKEEYVVWDPASGTLNLTRDYKFRELYCSTIEESDLKTADQMKYNPNAIKFQYDFLNDGIVDGRIDIESDVKLPQGLKDALLEGKKMIVLMNPPYGTANNAGTEEGDSKAGIALTELNKMMKSDEWGASSQQLYAQFLYRLTKMSLGNINICIFAKSLYKSGSSYKEFRKNFYKSFRYEDGMMFCASHFDGVSTSWGVDFSIWKSGIEDRDSLDIKVKDLNTTSYELEYLFDKEIFNLDSSEESSVWVRKEIKGLRTFDKPQLSSGILVKQKGVGKSIDKSIGYFYTAGNNVMKNSQSVGLFSDVFSNGHGISVIPQNFEKVVSFFTARKSITGKYANWINDKDEYMAPNESHPLWEQFQTDSLVYSLFNTSSNQSSLRQITYKDKLWDIKNEFFWMSKEEMMSLAESKYFDDVFRDARSSDERYVYTLLFKEGIYERLSLDAKSVLDTATELVRKSFGMRQALHEEHPEYHLNTWDCGWYQVKLILKQFYQDDLREFTKKYKDFEDRMRPLVYELGFLRN
jgi:hypothetical protein